MYARARHLKGTLRRFAVLVGHHSLGTVRDRAPNGGVVNSTAVSCMYLLENSADATAQNRIDLTGFRQCIQYHRRRDRSGNDRLATQDEKPRSTSRSTSGSRFKRQVGCHARACA